MMAKVLTSNLQMRNMDNKTVPTIQNGYFNKLVGKMGPHKNGDKRFHDQVF